MQDISFIYKYIYSISIDPNNHIFPIYFHMIDSKFLNENPKIKKILGPPPRMMHPNHHPRAPRTTEGAGPLEPPAELERFFSACDALEGPAARPE